MVYSFLRCKFEYYVKNTTRSAILKVNMFLFKCKCGMDFEEKKYESTFIYPKKAQLKKKLVYQDSFLLSDCTSGGV